MTQSIIPLLYLPGNVIRIRIKAIGDLDKKFNTKTSPELNVLMEKFELINKEEVEVHGSAKVEFKSSAEDEPLVPSEPYINPSTGEWELSRWDVECISIGAGVLGCGGGGDPYLGRIMLLKMLEAGKIPRIIHPDR